MNVNSGDKVRVEYVGSFRGKELVAEGVVVEDEYTHRPTPEDAIDIEVEGENGTYVGRIEDGVFKGLHHATARHDHRKGSVENVEVV